MQETPTPEPLHPRMGIGFSLDEAVYLRNLVLIHQKHVAENKVITRDLQQSSLRNMKGIIYLTPDYSSGSYLLMQRAIPPQPRGGCYAR